MQNMEITNMLAMHLSLLISKISQKLWMDFHDIWKNNSS